MNTHILTYREAEGVIASSKLAQRQQKQSFFSRPYIMCFCLYLLQGHIIAISNTMPYLYPQLPTYRVLALFTSTHLPFSFKFLLCPILQKYTNLSYGKRKTWIIISQTICSTVLFISSYLTQLHQATFLAISLMCAEFFLTIQDVCLDSLSIKELKSPQVASQIQTVSSSFGTVLGSLLLLKLTSEEFAIKIGLDEAITTPSNVIRFLSLMLLLTAISVHFFFKQTSLQCEKMGTQKSFFQIISSAKVFLDYKTQYCRLILFMLIYYQGLKFFEAGYDYQLIKHGFSRDTSNSISNLIAIPVLFLSFKMISLINALGIQRTLILVLCLQCLLYLFNVTVFSLSPYVVVVTQFCGTSLITLKSMILYIMSNSYPIHALTGMYLTITYSVWNLGQLNTFNTLIIDRLNWRLCTYLGITIQIFIIFQIPSLLKWIKKGIIDNDSTILEEQNEVFRKVPNTPQLSDELKTNLSEIGQLPDSVTLIEGLETSSPILLPTVWLQQAQ